MSRVDIHPVKHECPHDGCTHELSIMPSGQFSIGLGPVEHEWTRTCPKCGQGCAVAYKLKNRLGGTYPEYVGCVLAIPEKP